MPIDKGDPTEGPISSVRKFTAYLEHPYERFITASENEEQILASLKKQGHDYSSETALARELCAACEPEVAVLYVPKAHSGKEGVLLFDRSIYARRFVAVEAGSKLNKFNFEVLVGLVEGNNYKENRREECPTCGTRFKDPPSECFECGEVFEVVDESTPEKKGTGLLDIISGGQVPPNLPKVSALNFCGDCISGKTGSELFEQYKPTALEFLKDRYGIEGPMEFIEDIGLVRVYTPEAVQSK